ncbi:MAG: carbohydrate kinase family protein [Thermoplasmatota archaeon]
MRLDALRDKTVTVLPDLYTDAVCPVPRWPVASRHLGAIATRGGGNMPVGPITVKAGGNAANTAIALARLGANARLIANTDAVGYQLLRHESDGTGLDIGGVRVGRRGSATLALESPEANVMLSHAGPVAQFGPRQLQERDWESLEASDAVAVMNWSQNRQGTALLAAIARRLGKDGPFIFFDSGDPRHRGAEARGLVQPSAWWASIGAFGLNENELCAFSGKHLRGDDMLPAAQALARRLGTRIDFHSRSEAASVTADAVWRMPAYKTPARRLTGAGDAWNAGAIAGQLLGLPPKPRLRLAHKVATRYVCAPEPRAHRTGIRPPRRGVAA